jgi:hypothetical protein
MPPSRVVRSVSSKTYSVLESYKNFVSLVSLNQIKKTFELPFSIATMYTAYSLMKIPTPLLKLSEYYCKSCNTILTVFFPFYGNPNRLECPSCGYLLKRNWMLTLPFYYPTEEQYFFDGRQIISVTDKGFMRYVESGLRVWNRSLPLFKRDKYSSFHIINNFVNLRPVYFCGLNDRRHPESRIVSGVSTIIKSKQICRDCLHEAIHVWDNGKSLIPALKTSHKNRRDIAIKLFIDFKRLRSVLATCQLNRISRRTFYRMKENYGVEFGEIFKEH